MIYVLYENRFNVINPVLSEFYEKYPESTRIFYDDRANFFDFDKISTPPLLSSGWLIICNKKVSASLVRKMDDALSSNVIIVKATSSAELQQISINLEGVPYKLIDNYLIEKNTVIAWIHRNMTCERDVALYLYKRLHGRVSDIVLSVNMLQSISIVTKSDVNKYVQKSSRYSVNDLILFIVKDKKCAGMSYSSVVSVIHTFRYAMPWLLNTLIDGIDLYILVFNLISAGELSLHNYKEYKTITSNKNIGSLTDYRLHQIVSSYGSISTEYLLYLRQLICTVDGSVFSAYKLLNIFKML